MQRLVEARFLLCLRDAHRGEPVDQPEHPVREDEGVAGERRDRDELLAEKSRAAAVEEAVRAGGVDRRRGEDAEQNDPEEAADAVDAPDVERVVPAEPVLER